tara:strand:+ start:785 stop:1981 length:1197 start_codon:yes stop_codon:yes gene_type:complete
MLIGLVGKPSVGKSTFFKASTLAEVDIANYPFTTITKNEGVGYVKVECLEKDLNVKCNPREGYCLDGIRFVPVKLLDVAGLVPGAHKGLGQGNQFLDDLNQADVLIHIIDVSGSTNEKGESVPPLSYDPSNDVKFLEEELDMWYLRLIKKGWEKFARQVNQEKSQINKSVAKQLSSVRVTEHLMEQAIQELKLPEDILKWDEPSLKNLASFLRKATKPIIIACNKADHPGADKNIEKLKNEYSDYIITPCSAESELALREAAKQELIKYIPGDDNFEILKEENLNPKQLSALNFIKDNILKKYESTGVQQVLDDAVFKHLKYVAIFPAGVHKLGDQHGNILPDCFLMPPNTTALDFAYRLHSDIGDNFVKALDVKTKKPVGKDYVLQHRDGIEIATSK